MAHFKFYKSLSTTGIRYTGLALIVVCLAMVLIACPDNEKTEAGATCAVPAPASQSSPSTASSVQTNEGILSQVSPEPVASLPRFLDLGTTTCQPCKMMIPVIESLRTGYAGKLQVDFINLNTNPSAGQQYNVRTIPLQIFFDETGKELFRHVGYWPEEDIVNKWKELGYEFQ
jgi:thioredoxin 1